MSNQIRPMVEVLLQMECLLDEMVLDHGLQWGDVLALIHSHLQIHLPSGQEKFEDDSSPTYTYK